MFELNSHTVKCTNSCVQSLSGSVVHRITTCKITFPSACNVINCHDIHSFAPKHSYYTDSGQIICQQIVVNRGQIIYQQIVVN